MTNKKERGAYKTEKRTQNVETSKKIFDFFEIGSDLIYIYANAKIIESTEITGLKCDRSIKMQWVSSPDRVADISNIGPEENNVNNLTINLSVDRKIAFSFSSEGKRNKKIKYVISGANKDEPIFSKDARFSLTGKVPFKIEGDQNNLSYEEVKKVLTNSIVRVYCVAEGIKLDA